MLKHYEKIVKEILEKDTRAREDDMHLWYEICNKNYCGEIPLYSLPFGYVAEHSKEFPSYETITRVRRKVQEKHPSLRNPKVYDKRSKMQEGYIKYATT